MPKKTENSDFNWGEEGSGRSEKLIHVLSWVVVFLVVAFAGLYLRRDSVNNESSIYTVTSADLKVIKVRPDASDGRWTVLVGRFVSRDKAQAFAADYSLKGMRAELFSESSGFYVQVERFSDEDSALALSQTMLLAGFPARVSDYRTDAEVYVAAESSLPSQDLSGSEIVTKSLADEKAAAEMAVAERKAAEEKKAAVAILAVEKAVAEKAAAEKAAAEKKAAEFAAAQRKIAASTLNNSTGVVSNDMHPAGTLTAIAPGSDEKSTGITRLLRSITRDVRAGEWTIQAGVFSQEENVRSLKESLERNLFKAFVVPTGRGHKIQVGDCATREEAENMMERLKTIPEFKALEPYVVRIE